MIFPIEIYKDRRNLLLQNMPDNSAILIPSWPLLMRSGGTYLHYRQNSDLIYLSGFEEPNSCLLLIKEANEKYTEVLFVQEKSKEKELWDGTVFGVEMTSEVFQIDVCYSSARFVSIASHLLKNTECLYYSLELNPEWDLQVNRVIQTSHRKKDHVFLYTIQFV